MARFIDVDGHECDAFVFKGQKLTDDAAPGWFVEAVSEFGIVYESYGDGLFAAIFPTREGLVSAPPGSWIALFSNGTLTAFSDERFKARFDEVKG